MKLNLSTSTISVPIQDFYKVKHPLYQNSIHIKSALNWLKRAQDVTKSGGVSAWFSLLTGWAPPYIETTGYIISTFLECSRLFSKKELINRAISMGEFIIDQQLENGGFRTKTIVEEGGIEPTVFNTGQDILGLINVYKETNNDKFLESAVKAGDFLLRIQEKEGYWKRYSLENIPHTYDSRVAYALLSVYQITRKEKFRKAAIAKLNWVIKQQQDNGWFMHAELPIHNINNPITHTISYTIEGLLFSGLILSDERYINSAKKTADNILQYFKQNKFLPATFDKKWESKDRFSCLTGNSQLSVVWLKLFSIFRDESYLTSARELNSYMKSTQDIKNSDMNISGGIKGCLPIYGDIINNVGYCRLAYINWATKFFIDALLLEEMVKKGTKPRYL